MDANLIVVCLTVVVSLALVCGTVLACVEKAVGGERR
jgi:hypothetical protein